MDQKKLKENKSSLNTNLILKSSVVFVLVLVVFGALYISFHKKGATPSVQGASINSLRDPGLPYYPIYQNDNKDSGVIFYAQEGDKFIVLDEKDGWYNVIIDGNKTGWLSASDIRSREVVDK